MFDLAVCAYNLLILLLFTNFIGEYIVAIFVLHALLFRKFNL